ncbi:MAG TPA: hypothetical protein VKX16_15640 [Chloroflexota bacterium]|nr:hypothetical protein [Chloroflexota bacterium]
MKKKRLRSGMALAAGAAAATLLVAGMLRVAPAASVAQAATQNATSVNQLAFPWPSGVDLIASSGNAVSDLGQLDVGSFTGTSPWHYFHFLHYASAGVLGAYQQSGYVRVVSPASNTYIAFHTMYLGTYYQTEAQAAAMEQDALLNAGYSDSPTGQGDLSFSSCNTPLSITGFDQTGTQVTTGPYTFADILPTCKYTAFYGQVNGGPIGVIYMVFQQGNALGEVLFEPNPDDLSATNQDGQNFRNGYNQDEYAISLAAEQTINDAGSTGAPQPTNTPVSNPPTSTPVSAAPTSTPVPTATQVLNPSIKIQDIKLLEGKSFNSQKATKSLHSGSSDSFQVDAQYSNPGTLSPRAKITVLQGSKKLLAKTMKLFPSFTPNTYTFDYDVKFKVTKKLKLKAVVKVTLGAASDQGSLSFTVNPKKCPKGKTHC